MVRVKRQVKISEHRCIRKKNMVLRGYQFAFYSFLRTLLQIIQSLEFLNIKSSREELVD